MKRFLLLLALASSTALAQTYPAKPVKLIVNSGPSGPSDFFARGMGQFMPPIMGQPFVVENRAGAAGIIGTEAAAKAPADGYSLLVTVSAPISLNPYFYTKLPYDPLRDFAPVFNIGAITATYVAHPSLQASTMPELIALARAKPDTVLYGSWGVGSFPDLYRAWLEKEFNVQFRHIPYKEASQVTGGLLAGDIQVMFNPSGLIAPVVRSGKLKALATLGSKRSPFFPDLPSFKDLGYDLDFLGWTGLFAPAGTPRDVVMRLNTELNRLVADPAFVGKYLTPQSMDPRPGSPEDFAAFLRHDRETAGKLTKLAGVKPE